MTFLILMTCDLDTLCSDAWKLLHTLYYHCLLSKKNTSSGILDMILLLNVVKTVLVSARSITGCVLEISKKYPHTLSEFSTMDSYEA